MRGSRFEVSIKVGFLRSGAFDAQNLVTIPTVKLLHELGRLAKDELAAVENVVRLWPGL